MSGSVLNPPRRSEPHTGSVLGRDSRQSIRRAAVVHDPGIGERIRKLAGLDARIQSLAALESAPTLDRRRAWSATPLSMEVVRERRNVRLMSAFFVLGALAAFAQASAVMYGLGAALLLAPVVWVFTSQPALRPAFEAERERRHKVLGEIDAVCSALADDWAASGDDAGFRALLREYSAVQRCHEKLLAGEVVSALLDVQRRAVAERTEIGELEVASVGEKRLGNLQNVGFSTVWDLRERATALSEVDGIGAELAARLASAAEQHWESMAFNPELFLPASIESLEQLATRVLTVHRQTSTTRHHLAPRFRQALASQAQARSDFDLVKLRL
jgi:hypothetical protein